jgi:hypothetical protein
MGVTPDEMILPLSVQEAAPALKSEGRAFIEKSLTLPAVLL